MLFIAKLRGWTKKILWVNLSKREVKVVKYDGKLASEFVGGRGFAIKLLWDYNPTGVDPLSPSNLLIVAAGPLTGTPWPGSSRVVVASKSPLTGGYGDGSIGGRFGAALKAAGYDAIVVVGRCRKPCILHVDGNGRSEIVDAEELWGVDAYRAYDRLVELYGKLAGILLIGPGGENLVRFATIVSERGRSGGRPGIGAVMGSKLLKAIVVEGDGVLEVFDDDVLRRHVLQVFRELKRSPAYEFWREYGTMSTIEWANEVGVLPAYNFREGVFEFADRISGKYMRRIRVRVKGCPICPIRCGHVVRDCEGCEVEIDYENIAMLGSNLGIARLEDAAMLNRLADLYGLDTISLGNVLGFWSEAYEKKLVREGVEWGDVRGYAELIADIAERRGVGDLLADGVARVASRVGGREFAMHVKGLEVSAYNCYAAPAMALAYATSPIGAHHKDAWVISWEIGVGRTSYSRDKVLKVVELQRIRGGMFEVLTVCRFPWVELGLAIDYYVKMFQLVTGLSYSVEDFYVVADRIYALIRMYWVREFGSWSIEFDMPPERWFREAPTQGPIKGLKLDRDKFLWMLREYYRVRGWSEKGIPLPSTLHSLGLNDAIGLAKKLL